VILHEVPAWAATLLAVVAVVPQVRRLARRGDLAGVSVVGPMIGLVNETRWTAYIVDGDLWSAAGEPMLMLATNVALLAATVRAGAGLRVAATVAAAWAVGMTSIGVVGGWTAVGTALGLSYALQIAPCLWSAYRTVAPSGIAPATWLAMAGEAVLWTVYGAVHGADAFVLLGGVEWAAALAILARLARRSVTEGQATRPGRAGPGSRPGRRRVGSVCR
jgi:uncharacterized protein with PQ loop repeat